MKYLESSQEFTPVASGFETSFIVTDEGLYEVQEDTSSPGERRLLNAALVLPCEKILPRD